MLSPLYDKLFDRGFITFTDKRCLVVSDWLSPGNVKRMGLVDGEFYQKLPMTPKRQEYLRFHHANVFHGFVDDAVEENSMAAEPEYGSAAVSVDHLSHVNYFEAIKDLRKRKKD